LELSADRSSRASVFLSAAAEVRVIRFKGGERRSERGFNNEECRGGYFFAARWQERENRSLQ
jgi:hypothetical protein